jgi:CheY-like chemotaxis protein
MPPSTTPTKATVLLVDDDKFLTDMYAMKFTKEGYTVHAFLSVKDALSALRGGLSPDVIMSDIIMPEHDGFFFFEALRSEKLQRNAVLIALTNQSSDEERVHAESLGVQKYIIKASMIPSEVVSAVAESLK